MPPSCAGRFDRQNGDLGLCTPCGRKVCKTPDPTYADGHAGAVYGQYPPLVNASRKPGAWQTYDLVFNAPTFKDGKVETPAHVTLFHNGVLVQNHTPLIGAVAFRAVGQYSPHGSKGPITLQDHGNPVRFRNIWVRELKPRD